MSVLENHLADISRLMNELVKLVEVEHKGLQEGDLDAIEKTAAQKTVLSQKLDQNYQAIRLLIQDDTVRTLSEYIAKTPRENLGKLVDLYEDLMEASEQYKKTLDVNRRVLSKLLASRQSNYHFWQSLISQTVAPYDKSGRKKTLKTGSSLQLKA
jgi:flagellar biosynthesis/type III secretory pathway chaperone